MAMAKKKDEPAYYQHKQYCTAGQLDWVEAEAERYDISRNEVIRRCIDQARALASEE